MPDKIQNEKSQYTPGDLPFERFDFGRTEDMYWLKNNAIDTSITGIVFADLQGKIFYINDAAARMWRCTDPSDYINKSAGKFSQSREKSLEVFNVAISNGVWIGEIGGIRTDGSLNFLYLQANLVRNSQAVPVCLMYSFMDISEKKHLEEQVRKSEEKYRELFEKGSDILCIHDLKGNLIQTNLSFNKTYGWKATDLININLLDLVPERYQHQVKDYLKRVIEKGKDEGFMRGLTKNGREIVLEYNNIVISNETGSAWVQSSARDITERMKNERALKESEEKYRTILDNIEDGYYELDMAGNYTFFNNSACKIQGYSGSEMMGMNYRQYLDQENARKAFQTFNRVFTTGEPAKAFNWEIIKKDGTKCQIDGSISLIRDSDRNVTGFRGIARDITERKQLEAQMRIKDIAIEKSITGIILTDLKGIITFANDAAISIWGYEKSEFLGKYAAKFAQSWEQIVDILNTVHRVGFWKGEIGGVKKDGTYNIAHLSATLIRDTSDVPVCLMHSFVDVTEQKRLQEQMRVKECALTSSINGMVITDINGNIVYVNDAFYKMWGGNFPDEVIGRPVNNFAASEKDAREINKVIHGHGKWFGELMVKRRDGSTFDVQLSVNTVSDADMAPIHILYAFVDISDQKKAERDLKKSHDELEMRVMERTEELAEMNAALKVLLKRREKDKEHLETDVFVNVEKNISPYIKKLLNRKKMGALEREYILTIESHIKEIVSPFMRKLQTTYQKLTPTEIMVANLIRDAKSTKEIAQLLDTSIQTIEFHRKNIRQKLNLNNAKINLRSHLLSLT